MQKVMKVKLVLSTPQTESEGRTYQDRSWDIPFDSLKEDQVPATELEQNMLFALSDAFPDQYRDGIKHLLYGAMSPGGTLEVGSYKLTVGFENALPYTNNPAPKPLEA